jgi:hypothetical protein
LAKVIFFQQKNYIGGTWKNYLFQFFLLSLEFNKWKIIAQSKKSSIDFSIFLLNILIVSKVIKGKMSKKYSNEFHFIMKCHIE